MVCSCAFLKLIFTLFGFVEHVFGRFDRDARGTVLSDSAADVFGLAADDFLGHAAELAAGEVPPLASVFIAEYEDGGFY